MKNELIVALEIKGFNRWTKGNMDRLYINPTSLCLELNFYKTGNVSSAYLNGERISNSRGTEMKNAKCYIDIATGKCVSSYDVFVEAMEQIVAETEDELTAETTEATDTVETTDAAADDDHDVLYTLDEKWNREFAAYVFAKEFYMSGESIYEYTIEDAAYDLRNIEDDDRWNVPDGITANELCAAMNRVIAEMKELKIDETSDWTVGDWIKYAESEDV